MPRGDGNIITLPGGEQITNIPSRPRGLIGGYGQLAKAVRLYYEALLRMAQNCERVSREEEERVGRENTNPTDLGNLLALGSLGPDNIGYADPDLTNETKGG